MTRSPCKKRKFKIIKNLVLFSLICFAPNALTLQQLNKLWLGINVQRAINQKYEAESKWLFLYVSQIRFTKQTQPFQTAFMETGLGYQIKESDSLWMGYRFTKHVNSRARIHDDRLIQQWLSNRKPCFVEYGFRTRFEEVYRSDQKQLAIRFRERIALEFPVQLCNKINPLLFNEVFLTLNKTNYTSRKLIAENRLFLGFNYYIEKASWWEIGYILQYRSNTPLNRNRQLNHVLSINYNFR